MRRLLFALVAPVLAFTSAHAASSLATESSAFVRSYADSPVNWMPWGEAAISRARDEQKPLFVAIGTFTSELSRAMARQTFSNADTAAFLNEAFVCVIVDAKEQPQLTALYQTYIQVAKQLRGLPLNVWLTPELKPIEGANYLPPTEEWGKEGFSTVAKRVAAGWKADPAAQRAKADESVRMVTDAQPTSRPEPVDTAAIKTLVDEAKEGWRARFDATNGGFGDAPKHPEAELLRALLVDPAAQEMALTTLRALMNGALRDPLDGGFFRYVIDPEWRYPYFQKTLADQARLALALLDAAKSTGDAQFGEAARGALQYVLTQLRLPDGDFSAGEDATPETLAASYLWKASEIREILGETAAKEFSTFYGVTPEGNIPADTLAGIDTSGQNFLRPASPAAAESGKSLNEARAKLLAKREQRPAPLLEDNATSGMHGLLLQALTRAGVQLKDPQLLAAAENEVKFLRERMLLPDGTLRRIAGRSAHAAPEDYAFVIGGLQDYKAVAKNAESEELKKSLLKALMAAYWSDATGRLFTSAEKSEPAFWARVVSPIALPSDLPLVEPTLLIALSTSKATTEAKPEMVSSLIAAVAERVREAEEVARGELLLALTLASVDGKVAP